MGIVPFDLTDLRSDQGPKAVFGDVQGAVNHETYRPMKVLMGHESGMLFVLNPFLTRKLFRSEIFCSIFTFRCRRSGMVTE